MFGDVHGVIEHTVALDSPDCLMDNGKQSEQHGVMTGSQDPEGKAGEHSTETVEN